MTQHEYYQAVLEILEQIARFSGMSDEEYNTIDANIRRLGRQLPVGGSADDE
jgi:hypothetical protein